MASLVPRSNKIEKQKIKKRERKLPYDENSWWCPPTPKAAKQSFLISKQLTPWRTVSSHPWNPRTGFGWCTGGCCLTQAHLDIHRVRWKKTCKKGTLAFKYMFHPLILLERLHCCYIDFHCSYLYSYYISSRTLCIKWWDSAFGIAHQYFIMRFNKISFLYE
jgi:hypothetical protein